MVVVVILEGDREFLKIFFAGGVITFMDLSERAEVEEDDEEDEENSDSNNEFHGGEGKV